MEVAMTVFTNGHRPEKVAKRSLPTDIVQWEVRLTVRYRQKNGDSVIPSLWTCFPVTALQ